MIPKRALTALATTVLGLVLLLGFRTPEAPSLTDASATDPAIVGDPTPGSTVTPSPTAAAESDTGSPDASTPADTSTGSTSTAAYQDGTATGTVVTTRFGDVQVQVTVSGGAVTDVSALELPSGDRRTNSISEQAGPLLRESALVAQSAEIDLVSGATYTSRGYATSLQSALDQLAA